MPTTVLVWPGECVCFIFVAFWDPLRSSRYKHFLETSYHCVLLNPFFNVFNCLRRLIQKQVNSETAPAQFITTTFRPELVAVADRCYGIALQDRVSEIRSLEKVNNIWCILYFPIVCLCGTVACEIRIFYELWLLPPHSFFISLS